MARYTNKHLIEGIKERNNEVPEFMYDRYYIGYAPGFTNLDRKFTRLVSKEDNDTTTTVFRSFEDEKFNITSLPNSSFFLYSNSEIIHIASHGFANDINPYLSGIVFHPVFFNSQNSDTISRLTRKEDFILFASELSHINFKSRLTVLSACETGIGKIKKGEGILSLAQNIFLSGFMLHTEEIFIELIK